MNAKIIGISLVGISLIGTAIGAGQAAARSTEQQLIDFGFLPAPITPSLVVERAPVRPLTATERQLVADGFARPETRVVTRYRFVRPASEVELTETERQLREYGFLSTPLRNRLEPIDAE